MGLSFRRRQEGKKGSKGLLGSPTSSSHTSRRLLIALVACATVLVAAREARAETFADSQDDWSTTGSQGQKGWHNGYYNRSLDGDQTYQTGNFTPFSPAHWTGTQFDLNTAAAGPWTEIGRENTHPNGTNSAPGEEHWTVRR